MKFENIKMAGLTKIFFILMVLISVNLWAAENVLQRQLFTYEKNRNPQNIMVVYTELDNNCKFLAKPVFNFHWLMDRQRPKPVHNIIRKRIEKQIDVVASKNPNSFSVVLEKPEELKTDVEQFKLQVKSELNKDGECQVQNYLTLGPSDQYRNIRLKSIYAESKGLIIPDLVAVTLIGEDTKTGEPVKRTYQAN